jgi:hypothetical protein
LNSINNCVLVAIVDQNAEMHGCEEDIYNKNNIFVKKEIHGKHIGLGLL